MFSFKVIRISFFVLVTSILAVGAPPSDHAANGQKNERARTKPAENAGQIAAQETLQASAVRSLIVLGAIFDESNSLNSDPQLQEKLKQAGHRSGVAGSLADNAQALSSLGQSLTALGLLSVWNNSDIAVYNAEPKIYLGSSETNITDSSGLALSVSGIASMVIPSILDKNIKVSPEEAERLIRARLTQRKLLNTKIFDLMFNFTPEQSQRFREKLTNYLIKNAAEAAHNHGTFSANVNYDEMPSILHAMGVPQREVAAYSKLNSELEKAKVNGAGGKYVDMSDYLKLVIDVSEQIAANERLPQTVRSKANQLAKDVKGSLNEADYLKK